MTNCNSTFLAGIFNKDFSDKRTCSRSTKKILIFINCISLYSRPDVFFNIFLTCVYNIAGRCTSFKGASLDCGPVITLSYVDTNGDYIIIIIFFKPWDDNSCIKSTRISQNYFFFCHIFLLWRRAGQSPPCSIAKPDKIAVRHFFSFTIRHSFFLHKYTKILAFCAILCNKIKEDFKFG